MIYAFFTTFFIQVKNGLICYNNQFWLYTRPLTRAPHESNVKNFKRT